MDNFGYFPIFQPFKETFLLRNLSGNAIRLFIYFGLMAGNDTGETWVSLETAASYFGRSKRAISGWVKELEDARLVERMQFKPDEVAHTFLMPYGSHRLDDPSSMQHRKKANDKETGEWL